MKKSLKRVLSLALLLLMVLPLAVACNNSGNGGGGATIDDGLDELGIPKDVKFDGYEFTILVTGNVTTLPNPFAYTDTTTTMDEAVHRRNLAIEDKYDVVLSDIYEIGDKPTGNGPGTTRITQNHTSGDRAYDMAVVSQYDCGVLAYQGYLADLNHYPYLDLTQKWWDQSAVNSLKFKDKVFYTTGDINYIDDEFTFTMIFNKDIRAEEGIEDLYKLVEENKWTYDKMTEIVRTVSDDVDGNGIYDGADKYGLEMWNDTIYAMLHSTGERIVTIENDEIKLTLNTERAEEIITKYITFCQDKSVLNWQKKSAKWKQLYMEDRALFFMASVNAVSQLRDTETDYGFLPYPKFDSAQENYYSTMAPTHTSLFCIPAIVEDEDMTGIIVQAMAYESMGTITPAFYDKNLIGRTVRDDESVGMLDIIFGNKVFDLGFIYQIGTYRTQVINMLRQDNTAFSSIYAAYLTQAETDIKNITDAFSKTIE